jgi:predicted RNA-binding Zn ribbon-like protein
VAWPPRFLFLSGELSIDFAQTGGVGAYAKFERWNAPRDLADWFRASALALDLDRVTTRDLGAARDLRQAIWDAAQAVVAGRSPAPASVRVLNAAAARPDLVPALARGARTWAPGATATQALSTVARSAIAFFGSERRERLRVCKNPRCPLLFVDLSRPGKRAWCTMRRCGNLQKTARYRASRKGARAPQSR